MKTTRQNNKFGTVNKKSNINSRRKSKCRKLSKSPKRIRKINSPKSVRKRVFAKLIMDMIWLENCKKINISDEIAQKWLDHLKEKMSSESFRYFHKWDEHLLRKKEYLREVNLCVIFAVFFQYYEFDVKKECSDQNCSAFRKFCEEANISQDILIKSVLKLLGNEQIDTIDGLEEDLEIFQDLDLLILGTNYTDYKRYTELLRKEYFYLDDYSYKQTRLKILQTFLTIPAIYSTAKFREKFETKARENIKTEIDELKE